MYWFQFRAKGGSLFHPEIIILIIILTSCILFTAMYIGYVDYFESSTNVLTQASWLCAIITVLFLFWNARKQPKRLKRFFILLTSTILFFAMFRIGPVGNIAVIYHMIFGKKVTLITEVTPSNDYYFMRRGCQGELDAFKNSILQYETLCGISYEDWKTLKPNTPMLLVGTKSYFGINFERYAMVNEHMPILELSRYVHFSGFVYTKDYLQIRTKRLIYRNFD